MRLPTTSVVLALVAVLAVPSVAGANLSIGSSGPRVRALEHRLVTLRYLPKSEVDGQFTLRTWHAVVALQGWSGIARDGVVGPVTRRALRRAHRPRPWSRRRGIEIHVDRQVLLLVNHRRVRRAIHVSTGSGGRTPLGHFSVLRRERMSWSVRFQVWMPYAQYFYGGYALHEYPVVPAYPASHGCVRIPADEAPVVWRFGRTGMRVWTTAR